MKSFDTPVLFIIFNRPDTTQRVWDEIRRAKPARIFVAADAFREGNEDEFKRCEQVRAIVKDVDWECDVQYLFQDINLGCKLGVSTAINWFFDHVDEGIILEDDCLPHPDFFKYCLHYL